MDYALCAQSTDERCSTLRHLGRTIYISPGAGRCQFALFRRCLMESNDGLQGVNDDLQGVSRGKTRV